MPEPADIYQTQLQAGFELPPDKRFYFNGYAVAWSPTDITIILLLNNQPIATLQTSPTIAKTLTKVMEGLIQDYENRTGQKVLTLDEVTSALSGAP
jgi:hypothetical protein